MLDEALMSDGADDDVQDTIPGSGIQALITDETPELDEETFDPDAWVSGVRSTVRAVTLYQRPDLLAEVEILEKRLSVLGLAIGGQAVPEGEDALSDMSTEEQGGLRAELEAQLEAVLTAWSESGRVFKVQGRSDEWRERAQKRLRKAGVKSQTELVLRQLADSIIEPKGITWEHLQVMNETIQPQMKMLMVAWSMANNQPPRVNAQGQGVDVPFSQGSLPNHGGRRS